MRTFERKKGNNRQSWKPSTLVEEVSMKWMDRPSVTEMERGGVYEIDRPKSAKKWKFH